jgi:hypothetical protein
MSAPHGLRRRIVELLELGPSPTHDIAAYLDADLAAVRAELARMRDAGAARSNARGWHLRRTYHDLTRSPE